MGDGVNIGDGVDMGDGVNMGDGADMERMRGMDGMLEGKEVITVVVTVTFKH